MIYDLKIEKMGVRQTLAIVSGILSAYADAAAKNPVVQENLHKGHKSLSGELLGELVRTAAMVDQVIVNLKNIQDLANSLASAEKELDDEGRGVLECLIEAVNSASDNYDRNYEAIGKTVFYDEEEENEKVSDDIALKAAEDMGIENPEIINRNELSEDVPEHVRDIVEALRARGAKVQVREIKRKD